MSFGDLILHPNQIGNKIRGYRNRIRDTLGPPKFSLDVIFLFLNNLTWGFALFGMLSLFLPIFLFERFNYSIQNVLIFYIISGTIFGFLVPLGAKIMSKIGLKKSIILSIPFLLLYCLSLYYFESQRLFIFLIFAILTINLFRILYWTPYHVEFAKFTFQKDRGKQIAYLSSFGFIIWVVAPFLAGFIIDQVGFSFLFIISMIIIAISIFPLFFLSPVREEFSFSYFQTFKEVFSRKNRKLLIGYGSDGAQSIVSVVIWPIFIFGILEESYMAVGGITAAVILAAIIFQLFMGTLADLKKKRSLIKIGTGLYALGWILKMFVANAFQIFVVSTYHSFTGIARGIPFFAFVYEQMADQGHYIDEYTILREVSINIGRTLMLIASFILLGYAGLTWTFLLAALASLFISIL